MGRAPTARQSVPRQRVGSRLRERPAPFLPPRDVPPPALSGSTSSPFMAAGLVPGGIAVADWTTPSPNALEVVSDSGWDDLGATSRLRRAPSRGGAPWSAGRSLISQALTRAWRTCPLRRTQSRVCGRLTAHGCCREGSVSGPIEQATHTIRSGDHRGTLSAAPSVAGRRAEHASSQGSVWWTLPSHRSLRSWTRPGQATTGLDGRPRGRFSRPFLLFAAAVKSRPRPSRRYARYRSPTSLEVKHRLAPLPARASRSSSRFRPDLPHRVSRETSRALDLPAAYRSRANF